MSLERIVTYIRCMLGLHEWTYEIPPYRVCSKCGECQVNRK